MGIMAGMGTVKSDNPMLNCRIEGGRNPVRIICDSHLSISKDSNIVKTAKDIKTIIACCEKDSEKAEILENAGCEVLEVQEKDGFVDLKNLMVLLGQKGIDSVLLEGGGELNYSALKDGIVNEVNVYIGPYIFGGKAKTPVGGCGIEEVSDAFKFKLCKTDIIDGDVLLTYKKEE